MNKPCVHFIGGGLAGFSSAFYAQKFGFKVHLYEASSSLGGRIKKIDRFDNGTHLIIDAYKDTFQFLNLIHDTLPCFDLITEYKFFDVLSHENWDLPADRLFSSLCKGHIPGVNFTNLISLKAKQKFWRPLLVSIFNTEPSDIPKRLILRTLIECLKVGHKGLRGYLFSKTLFDLFIEPLIDEIDVQTNQRLIKIDKDKILFKNKNITLKENEYVILALPANSYEHIDCFFEKPLLTFNPIVNVHFFYKHNLDDRFVGLINSKIDWIRVKKDMISITISNFTLPKDKNAFAIEIWNEVSLALKIKVDMPDYKILTEKYATPRQDQSYYMASRNYKSCNERIYFAGDWVVHGMPATIETAIRSGKSAAYLIKKNHFNK